MSESPAAVDAEVAAVTWARDLGSFFTAGRPAREPGWARIDVDPLHTVVVIPARPEGGGIDPFLVLLGAECYDLWPPSAIFVEPGPSRTWVEPAGSSAWWPRLGDDGVPAPFSFGLHHDYNFQDGRPAGQLICFSQTLGYYQSNHAPQPGERWRQGTHTVTSTLSRLADVLVAPYYAGRGCDSPA